MHAYHRDVPWQRETSWDLFFFGSMLLLGLQFTSRWLGGSRHDGGRRYKTTLNVEVEVEIVTRDQLNGLRKAPDSVRMRPHRDMGAK